MVQTSQGTSLKCGRRVFGYRFVGGEIRHALCNSRYFFKKLYRYIVCMYVYIWPTVAPGVLLLHLLQCTYIRAFIMSCKNSRHH